MALLVFGYFDLIILLFIAIISDRKTAQLNIIYNLISENIVPLKLIKTGWVTFGEWITI